ncbi:glycine cleavage system aminomethyltransferase GcvT [Caenibius sp. WL]|uniref:glycine cleavage system aminomethyltransferase GcvT n=1 Tax=Caenibius sp. WL TaxID=2872646 RepID=UPI001C98F61D|nr:glycine cleavage system aminomethyltransferase GcvT [Caenibius sp. WL]QZP08368.1 glycine cleavage system aminomethyltransferase GcvT [Caenibius sp. WL]
MSDLQTQLDEADDAIDLPTEPLPLDAWHRAHGGRMVDFAGYWMPVQFRGIIEEHLWTRSKAGLFDVSHMGQLEISGEGAVAALEAVLPGDIAGLAPGRMRYSLLLDEQGGILDDLMVTNRGGTYYLVVNGAMKWDDIAHLRDALPDDITLNHLDEHGLLALQGPEAAAVLVRLGLEPAMADAPAVDGLTFMQAAPYLWQGRPLGISRSGYTGEDGFEISVRAEDIAALADALCADEAVMPVGLGARDSLRLEAGLPLYGHDLTPETGPVEAGLMFAINKRRRAEGGFPGAERILAELAAGPARKRIGLLLDGRLPAREGAPVLADGAPIGVVTSGGFSPTLERPIAMAMVDAAHAAPGATLEIEVRGRKLAASVTAMPFVPHKYHRQGA